MRKQSSLRRRAERGYQDNQGPSSARIFHPPSSQVLPIPGWASACIFGCNYFAVSWGFGLKSKTALGWEQAQMGRRFWQWSPFHPQQPWNPSSHAGFWTLRTFSRIAQPETQKAQGLNRNFSPGGLYLPGHHSCTGGQTPPTADSLIIVQVGLTDAQIIYEKSLILKPRRKTQITRQLFTLGLAVEIYLQTSKAISVGQEC